MASFAPKVGAILVLALLALEASAEVNRCPFTGQRPVKSNTGNSRCVDAGPRTCCDDCTETRNALKFVASNASNFLNAISPSLLTNLGDKDINFCTAVYPAATCQDVIEQIACALECNPRSWKYVEVGYESTTFTITPAFNASIVDSCKYVRIVLGAAEKFLGDVILPKYTVQAIVNVVTSTIGLPHVDVVVNDTADAYNGPSKLPSSHLCCDSLGFAGNCPSSVSNITGTGLETYSGETIDPNMCRAGDAFALAPVAALSSPPPPPPAPLSGKDSNSPGSYTVPPPSAAGSLQAGLLSVVALLVALVVA